MSIESVNYTDNPNPEVQALGIADNLIFISKREVWYSHATLNKEGIPPSFIYNHALLLMAQRSLTTELEQMGFADLAYFAVDQGVRQANERRKVKEGG